MTKVFKTGAILLTLVGVAFTLCWHKQHPQVVEAYNADNLIRFHVIANSDSDVDQALKLKVRDSVIQAMTPAFSQTGNIQEARNIVKQNLHRIEDVACAEINKQGQNYPVNVSLGEYMFPTKTYGNLTLPAGKYEAVRVVIGNGQGANWWCVLFPPLCFVGLSADRDGEFQAEQPVSVGADRAAAANGTDEPQIEVKFKVVEVFEDSVTKVVRVLGKHLVALKEQDHAADK